MKKVFNYLVAWEAVVQHSRLRFSHRGFPAKLHLAETLKGFSDLYWEVLGTWTTTPEEAPGFTRQGAAFELFTLAYRKWAAGVVLVESGFSPEALVMYRSGIEGALLALDIASSDESLATWLSFRDSPGRNSVLKLEREFLRDAWDRGARCLGLSVEDLKILKDARQYFSVISAHVTNASIRYTTDRREVFPLFEDTTSERRIAKDLKIATGFLSFLWVCLEKYQELIIQDKEETSEG